MRNERQCAWHFLLGLLVLGCLILTETVGAEGLLSFVRRDFRIHSQDPEYVTVEDFNRDGNPDIATANGLPNSVSILLGRGDGTFSPAQDFGVGGEPRDIKVGDFNRDGVPDLALPTRSKTGFDSISILRGKGDGTFGPVPGISLGRRVPNALVVGHFNRDRNLDLATANVSFNPQMISVSLGRSDGTFNPARDFVVKHAPSDINASDFNNDGRLDITTANTVDKTVSILLGRGDGTFGAARNLALSGGPRAIAVGDFNDDGDLDVATANSPGNTVSVLLGRGDGTFEPAVAFLQSDEPFEIEVGDFNHDGHLDISTANRGDDTVSILLGQGDGTFKAAMNFQAPQTADAVATGDFNRDQRLDLATVNNNHTVSIWINTQPIHGFTGFGLGAHLDPRLYIVGMDDHVQELGWNGRRWF